jgi:hypothetical protein
VPWYIDYIKPRKEDFSEFMRGLADILKKLISLVALIERNYIKYFDFEKKTLTIERHDRE